MPYLICQLSYFQKRDTFPAIRNNDEKVHERRLGCMKPNVLTLSLHSRPCILQNSPARSGDGSSTTRLSRSLDRS